MSLTGVFHYWHAALNSFDFQLAHGNPGMGWLSLLQGLVQCIEYLDQAQLLIFDHPIWNHNANQTVEINSAQELLIIASHS